MKNQILHKNNRKLIFKYINNWMTPKVKDPSRIRH